MSGRPRREGATRLSYPYEYISNAFSSTCGEEIGEKGKRSSRSAHNSELNLFEYEPNSKFMLVQ